MSISYGCYFGQVRQLMKSLSNLRFRRLSEMPGDWSRQVIVGAPYPGVKGNQVIENGKIWKTPACTITSRAIYK